MKSLIFFVALLAIGSDAEFEAGLKVKFGVGFSIGKDYFMGMPRTISAARVLNWVEMERPPNSHLPGLRMWCVVPTHYSCCLYDQETESLAGYQVGIPLNEFTDPVFDWEIQGFIPWEVTTTKGTITYMTKSVFFVSEVTLRKSKSERLEIAAKGAVLVEDSLWVTGFHQKLMKVSTNVTQVVKDGWVKQGCIPLMGTHYFYQMNSDLKCSSGTLLNYFLLFDGDQFIGLGLVVFGVVQPQKGATYYFEQPSQGAVKVILKYKPGCLVTLAGKPTLTTQHLYVIDKPWTVGCYAY